MCKTIHPGTQNSTQNYHISGRDRIRLASLHWRPDPALVLQDVREAHKIDVSVFPFRVLGHALLFFPCVRFCKPYYRSRFGTTFITIQWEVKRRKGKEDGA